MIMDSEGADLESEKITAIQMTMALVEVVSGEMSTMWIFWTPKEDKTKFNPAQ